MTHVSEEAIQVAIVQYLRTVLTPPNRVVHIPMNPRSMLAGVREKRMGSLKGIPDLAILRTAQRVAWIEVKGPKGRLTPQQREFQLWCRDAGHPHCVARSIDDVRDFLEAEGIPNRETETLGEAAKRLSARMDWRVMA